MGQAMNAGLGEQLAAFATGMRLEDVPARTVDYAKSLILKTVAGMLAGSAFPAGRKIVELVKSRNQSPQIGVIGHGFKTSL